MMKVSMITGACICILMTAHVQCELAKKEVVPNDCQQAHDNVTETLKSDPSVKNVTELVVELTPSSVNHTDTIFCEQKVENIEEDKDNDHRVCADDIHGEGVKCYNFVENDGEMNVMKLMAAYGHRLELPSPITFGNSYLAAKEGKVRDNNSWIAYLYERVAEWYNTVGNAKKANGAPKQAKEMDDKK